MGNLLKWRWEARRGSSHHTTPSQLQEEGSISDLQQKNPQERMISSNCHQEKRDIASPTISQLPLQLSQLTIITLNCFSPVGFPSKQPLPTSSLLLHKITFIFFVEIAYGFCCSLLLPNHNFLLFPNKIHFC